MAAEKLSKMDVSELTKNKAKLKAIIIAVTIVWLFLIACVTYLFIFKKKSASPFIAILTAVPITLLPAVNSLVEINKEIKLRN
jgi:flagellar basal body-associated protein FliL